VTSDAPQLQSIGQDPLTDGMVYFSITTQGAWRTPASAQEFDIYIDSNGDGSPDAVLFNTRLPGTDVMIDELIDLNSGEVIDAELINARAGDTDTALMNSNTLVMPVAIGALPGISANTSRIKYGVFSFSPYQGAPVDQVGDIDNNGNFVNPLTMDVLRPGVSVAGSYDGDASPLLFRDSPGSVLAIRRDAPAYAADHGLGALMIHFQNTVGNNAQIVSLAKSASHASLSLSPSPVVHNHTVTAKITVTGKSGVTPTGAVVLRQLGTKPVVVASGTLTNGKVTLHFTPKAKGTFKFQAQYGGDFTYGSSSATVTLKVT
jgi:hypothetical protein